MKVKFAVSPADGVLRCNVQVAAGSRRPLLAACQHLPRVASPVPPLSQSLQPGGSVPPPGGGIRLAELMSGKCSGVPGRKRRGRPLVIPCAKAGELQDRGEGPGKENWELNHLSTSLLPLGSACSSGLELLSKVGIL